MFDKMAAQITTGKIKEIMQQSDFIPIHEDKYVMYLYDKRSEYVRRGSEPPLPKGFTIGRLRTEHDAFLEKKMLHLPYSPTYAKTLQNYINLAVYSDDNTPVAWTLLKEYGELGYAFTDPSFRRHGFGSIILTKLAFEVSQFQDAYAFVRNDNIAAHSTMQTCGLTRFNDYQSTVLVLKKNNNESL
ncbi:uncharacterized protein LOC144445123 isoform X2 [Glandiceps talaboti]